MQSPIRVIGGFLSLALFSSLLTGCAMKSDPYAAARDRYGNGETQNGGIGKGTLRRVNFGFDQSTLRKEDRANLDYNISKMNKDKKMVLLVEGHTDRRGSEEYNIALGEQRAKAAKTYLTDKGVSPARVKTKSWGEEKPLGRNDSAIDHAANRRAEFVVLEKSPELN